MNYEPILEAACEYGEARRVQLALRRRQASYGCNERGDETPACWQASLGNESDWCEPCQKRQPHYREWRSALLRERKALKVLQRALQRAERGEG